MGASAEKMIFIVGMSRSGTTLLGRILGANASVHTFEELHFFERLASSEDIQGDLEVEKDDAIRVVVRLLTSSDENIFAKMDFNKWQKAATDIVDGIDGPRSIGNIYKAFLSWSTTLKGCTIACEQTPRYIYCLNDIFHLFPDARVVNMIRDPRDVLLSQRNKWRTYKHGTWDMPIGEALRVWVNYSPITQSLMWRSCIERANEFSSDPRVLNIKFEHLLSQPEEIIHQVCGHIGIEYTSAMLDVEKIGSSIAHDQKGARGIDMSYSARWKRGGISKREISVCEFICRKQMLAFDYKLAKNDWRRLAMATSLPGFAFKSIAMLALNLNRSKSIVTFALTRLGLK